MDSIARTVDLKYLIAVYDNESLVYPVKDGKLLQVAAPTKEFYDTILSQSESEHKYYFDFIPDNVIKFRTEVLDIMWYIKPQYKNFLFAKNLDMKDGERKIP